MVSKSKLKTTPKRSRLMSRIRQSGTSAELIVRNILYHNGVGFGVKAQDLPGTPDIVNRGGKWAIFVHGCFWHAHQGCSRWKIPSNNSDYWRNKFQTNRKRDKMKVNQLERLGFSVLTIWECELERRANARRKILSFIRECPHYHPDMRPTITEDSRLWQKAPPTIREQYAFTPSGKYVSRAVRLHDGKTQKTRVFVGNTDQHGRDAQAIFEQAFLRKDKGNSPRSDLPGVQVCDLFSGCGGLSLGAREACVAAGRRFDCVLTIDNDDTSLEVYRANFMPQNASRCDIREHIDGRPGSAVTKREKELLNRLDSIDILLAGPPCQGHSDLNNHTRRKDPRNGLYAIVGRFAEIAAPSHILIENVPAIVHSKEGVLDNTMSLLSSLGYLVEDGVVDLSEIGVPQKRKRHVLVASIRRLPSIEKVIAKHRVDKPRTVQWSIGDLVDAEESLIDQPTNHSPENLKRIRYLLDHDLYDLPNHLRPPCHRRNHSYKSMYGRLKWDETSQTITSGFGSPGQGRFIHPEQPRALTPHEAARLQFFPDSFDFSAATTRTSLANMIGNAVPMKLSYVFCLEFVT